MIMDLGVWSESDWRQFRLPDSESWDHTVHGEGETPHEAFNRAIDRLKEDAYIPVLLQREEELFSDHPTEELITAKQSTETTENHWHFIALKVRFVPYHQDSYE